MRFFTTLTALVFSFELFSQQAINYARLEVKSMNKGSRLPSSFVFSPGNTNRPDMNNINEWFRQNLNANNEFKLIEAGTIKDVAGFTHIRYKQFYNNIPVEGSMVNTHFRNGTMQSMNGNYYTQLNVVTTPALDQAAALKIALSTYGQVEFAWNNPAEEALLRQIEQNPSATYAPCGELVIISPNYSQVQESFRLAWKFNIYVAEPLMRELIYIDALNGEILYTENQIHTTDVKGRAISRYCDTVDIMCDSLGPVTYVLRESGRGNGIQTYNGKQGTKLDTNAIFSNTGKFWDLRNNAKDEVAIDVQWGLEQSYDFYKNVLGINSINDSGFRLRSVVHYRTNYNNANWNGQYINFGDGDGSTFKPLTSIDICGHEMTHGLTQKCAGLIYKNESGGLNESFSDIFGKCIEHYAIPDSFSWIIGKKIQFNGNFLRSMEQPNLKNNPKYYMGQYFIPAGTLYDNGGVHINSGVSNYWFYLLCEGGSGFREVDQQPFYVKPIGWDKATKIAYITLSAYLTPTSEFFDASELSQQVAANLYGDTSFEAKQVLTAWYGVGLASISGNAISSVVKLGSKVTLAPNPALDIMRVKMGSNGFEQAAIMDITGKQLRQVEVYDGAEINVSDLERGVYLLNFRDGSSVKFVKM